MTIGFPNRSRSYDAEHQCIRFWGHDSTMEVTFQLDQGALLKLMPATGGAESALLAAFDKAWDRIIEVAMRTYTPRQQSRFYILSASDF